MASPIAQGWLYATVPIDNPQGESGTGFLVFRETDGDQGKVFLATNKHVVHRDHSQRGAVTHLVCHFNVKAQDGSIAKASSKVVMQFPDGVSRYREHPDPDTDVAAIEVTDLITLNPHIEKRWATYADFADSDRRDELDITAGEEIITVGYPLGLRQGDTNFPLVRQGILATKIGYPLKDKVGDGKGGVRDRTIRAFLIDGATVPGSSGSPVVLKPVIGRQIKNTILLDPAPPLLLGIVAETKYAPLQHAGSVIPGFASLGLVFEADTVRETIELFFA